MRGSETIGRLIFAAIGLCLFAGLFLWSDAVLRANSGRNPFWKIEQAAPQTDWVILGASHALPLGMADMEHQISQQTGQKMLNLGVTGGGPFVIRLVAERFFTDHGARSVMIVLDEFSFADARWNRGRFGDADLMAKIPADKATLAVMARALGWGLRWQDFLAYASGFARINDAARFRPDLWQADARFEAAPRPSDAADAARIAFLYPGPADPQVVDQAFADLAATVQLAHDHDAQVVIALPPMPDRFRARLPHIPEFSARLAETAGQAGARVIDDSASIAEPRYYFDTDHLNRDGVLRWLDQGLAAVFSGPVVDDQ